MPPHPGEIAELLRQIERGDAQAHDQLARDCRFALLKPGVDAAAVSFNKLDPTDALVLLAEVNAQGTSKIIKEERVPPGRYPMRFECRGFQTVSGPTVIAENSQRPGWATVAFELKRK